LGNFINRFDALEIFLESHIIMIEISFTFYQNRSGQKVELVEVTDVSLRKRLDQCHPFGE